MWHIIRTEFRYNKILFLSVLSFVPIVAYLAVYPPMEDLPHGIFLFILFQIPIQNWIIFKNRENRDRQQAQLPLSRATISGARIGLLVSYGVFVIAVYSLLRFVLKPNWPVGLFGALVAFGIILIIFSTYFILRDLLLFFMRNNRLFQFTKERTKMTLIFIVLGLNLLGIYYFLVALDGPTETSALVRMIRFIKYDPLLNTGAGIIKYMSGCLLFSLLSILTYSRRSVFLE